MGFTLPSSKKKQYLSGSDWIINALDYMLKRETCAGNISQVVLMLNGVPDGLLLQERLNHFIGKFPVIRGSVARDINLAPYWRIPRESRTEASVKVHTLDRVFSAEDTFLLFEKNVNSMFRSDAEHLAFHLVHRENGQSSLAMTFDHRLFDGRGAEMFLSLFQKYLSEENGPAAAEDFQWSAPAKLSQWMEKFHAGKMVNRKLIALSKTSAGALPIPPEKNRGFRFTLIPLNQSETDLLYDTACSEAGYLMEMPYLLSVVIQSFHELFKSRGLAAPSYLIPLSIDMRRGEDLKQELFFNHVSYLFFQVPQDRATDLKGMIGIIKKQMYDQIQSGLPKDIQEACLLTRIAPLPVLDKLFRIPVEGKIASFCFSHVGKSAYLSDELMGVKIDNIFHMPRVPVPPGLGFFFNYFNGRLNLIISHLDGLLQEDEILMLEAGLKEKLRPCQR